MTARSRQQQRNHVRVLAQLPACAPRLTTPNLAVIGAGGAQEAGGCGECRRRPRGGCRRRRGRRDRARGRALPGRAARVAAALQLRRRPAAGAAHWSGLLPAGTGSQVRPVVMLSHCEECIQPGVLVGSVVGIACMQTTPMLSTAQELRWQVRHLLQTHFLRCSVCGATLTRTLLRAFLCNACGPREASNSLHKLQPVTYIPLCPRKT